MFPEVIVSEPQLRCLLCDLILAEEGRTDYPTETCKQCGRKVLAGQTAGGEPPLQPLGPPPRSKPVDLDLETLPEASVVPPPPAAPSRPQPQFPDDDIPSVPVVNKARRADPDVPTVQPRGKISTSPASVPYAARPASPPAAAKTAAPRPAPPRKAALPDPSRAASVTPRPRVLQAFAILGCMTVLAVAAIVVIISCIVMGLMTASKLGR
jgi:hypothetical protein